MNNVIKKPWSVKLTAKLEQKKLYAQEFAQKYDTFNKCKGHRMADCASYLIFSECQLVSANFCQLRLCPICSWRKSMKMTAILSEILQQKKHQNKRYLFLTLTLKNCDPQELAEEVDHVLNAWSKMTSNKRCPLRRRFSGMFRALEITYNAKTNQYHPHIHVLVECEKDYFSKKNANYLKTAGLVALWRSALSVDYDPVCSIKAVKNLKGQVLEVAKYTVKGSDIGSTGVLQTFDEAIEGRRLFSFHDSLKTTKRELKDGRDVDTDYIFGNPEIIKEVFRWNESTGKYQIHETYDKEIV